MKKRTLSFLLVFLAVHTAKAQSYDNRELFNDSFITTDLISPFYASPSIYTPRYRLGYIYSFSEKLKLGVDFGYGNKPLSLLKTYTNENYNLWEFRPELYYTFPLRKRSVRYYAVELFYINHTERFVNGTFLNNDNTLLRYDEANYTRHKFGIIPKFGVFTNLSDKIGLNIYMGLGARYRINDYSNLVNAVERDFDDEHRTPFYRYEGDNLGLEFSFGLKLFYKVRGSKN